MLNSQARPPGLTGNKHREAAHMERKLEIIARMVANGYKLMGRTPAELAAIFTESDLLAFERQFMSWRDSK